MRIFAVSDLHTDFRENWLLIGRLSDLQFKKDALIVAGDIADRIETIGATLSLLRSKFDRVFYTPGNHELWVRDQSCDSIEKLNRILELCERLDVQTEPGTFGDAWVVPLFSWYARAFDFEDREHGPDIQGWADFHLCKWPDRLGDVHDYFLGRNESSIRPYDRPVISFSHFLPRRELLPSREHLRFKDLPKVAGSTRLEEQIRKLKSVVHVFGHSHINCDEVIDGIRYVQNALLYPKERKRFGQPLKEVWECRQN